MGDPHQVVTPSSAFPPRLPTPAACPGLAWNIEPGSALARHLSPAFPFGRGAALPTHFARDGLPVVMRGLVARCVTSTGGTRHMVALLAPGDVCCDGAFTHRADERFVALTACVVACLPFAAAYGLGQERPAFGRAIWRVAARAAGIQAEWLRGMLGPADRRLAHRMCEILLRLRCPAGVDGIALPCIPCAAWADLAGMTAVHAQRCLIRLSALGFVRSRRRAVTVLDPSGLAAFSEFDPAYLWPNAPLPADELALALAAAEYPDFKEPFL